MYPNRGTYLVANVGTLLVISMRYLFLYFIGQRIVFTSRTLLIIPMQKLGFTQKATYVQKIASRNIPIAWRQRGKMQNLGSSAKTTLCLSCDVLSHIHHMTDYQLTDSQTPKQSIGRTKAHCRPKDAQSSHTAALTPLHDEVGRSPPPRRCRRRGLETLQPSLPCGPLPSPRSAWSHLWASRSSRQIERT